MWNRNFKPRCYRHCQAGPSNPYPLDRAMEYAWSKTIDPNVAIAHARFLFKIAATVVPCRPTLHISFLTLAYSTIVYNSYFEATSYSHLYDIWERTYSSAKIIKLFCNCSTPLWHQKVLIKIKTQIFQQNWLSYDLYCSTQNGRVRNQKFDSFKNKDPTKRCTPTYWSVEIILTFFLAFRGRRRRRWRQDIGDGRQRQTVPERRDQRQHDVDDHDAELERVVDHAGDPQPFAVEPEKAATDQRDRRRPGHSEPRVQRHFAHPVAER